MASVNKAIIVGNLGHDPDIKYLPNGDAVANLNVATTDKWKDKTTGEIKEATEWHRVSFFGKVAEICGQYLTKGSQVYIEGSIHTRKWQDKDGADRYTTEIRGDRMQMLGSKRDGATGSRPEPAQPAPERRPAPARASGTFDDMDSDLPFN